MTPTNALTKAIVDYLNLNGHCADRINTVGVYDPTRKVFRKNPNTAKGIADIVAIINGKHYEFEIKIGKDRMSDAQKARCVRVTKAGGRYYIIKTWDEFEQLAAENGWAR